MKNLSLRWLEKHDACNDAVNAFAGQKERNIKKVMRKLIENDKLDWANWLIVRLLGRKDKLKYAIFAAEQVIEIYEKKYPNDDRPRKAIEAAKLVLKKNNPENRSAADAAADAAYAAAYAAYAAAYAAYAAADAAADAAAYAAYAAAYAAYAAACAAACAAADAAAYAAADAAYVVDAKKEMKIKILNYGIKLL